MSETGPGALSSTMITIVGPVPSEVTAPPCYVGQQELVGKFGPLLLVIKDPEGWAAARKFLEDMLGIGNEVWPEMDSFARVQAQADRRMAVYGTERPTRDQRRRLAESRRSRAPEGHSL